MAELISGVSSFEGITAAVVNGADAVYLSFNYDKAGYTEAEKEIRRAADYCRARDVKFYVSIEQFPADDEFSSAVEYARLAWRLGADAAVLSDLGLAKILRTAVPDMPVHAGSKMALFNSDGMKIAKAMGISRVYLPKELTGEEIAEITKNSSVETAVSVQGDMCSSVDGYCLMCSMLGGQKDTRGNCIRACKYQYSMVGNRFGYPLSLKDNCLIRHVTEMEKNGVAGFLINGFSRLPEYTAMVTNVYYNYMKANGGVSMFDCMSALEKAYVGQEMTDLFYTDKKGELMIGEGDFDQRENPEYPAVRKKYRSYEFNRVPVSFVVIIKEGEPVKLTASDNRGHVVNVEGSEPGYGGKYEIRRATVMTQCRKTGGTPYLCSEVRSVIDKGLTFSGQELGELVSKALEELTEKRKEFEERSVYPHTMPEHIGNKEEKPVFTVSVLKADQLSEEMLRTLPKVLYIPLEEIKGGDQLLRKFLQSPGTTVCAVLPRVIKDSELPQIGDMLKRARSLGVNEVCVSNISHVVMTKRAGFTVRGDIGLNVNNSATLAVYGRLGLTSAVLSPELNITQIREMSKPIDTEIVAYGRLPLMYTDNCIIKNNTGLCTCEKPERITGTNGMTFPVVGGFGCRNTVYNARKLFIGDKNDDYDTCGLYAVRLVFTTEHRSECAKIVERFAGSGSYEPTFYTRGLYYRGAV